MLRCLSCNAPRDGEVCHKCGSNLEAASKDWEEPQLPPIDHIRSLARELGYAIGLHGTQERDLDLIAAPWVEAAVDQEMLVTRLCEGIGARKVSSECKPCGRKAYTLQMNGWYKPIDLSVMPSLTNNE